MTATATATATATKAVRGSDARLVRGVVETAFLKEGTKAQYLASLAKAAEVYGGPRGRPARYAAILSDPVGFADRLVDYGARRGLGDHSLDALMAAVMSLWNYNQDLRERHAATYREWQEQKRRVFAPIAQKYRSNEPTDRQREAYVSFERLCEVRDALPDGSDARLLLHMYTDLPPVRGDYYCTRIYDTPPRETDECGNYLVLPRGPRGRATVVLQEYKTSKRYNRIELPVPDATAAQIRASLAARPRDHLFVSPRTGAGFAQRGSFGRWANHLLRHVTGNPRVTLTTLRHVYISRRDLALHMQSGVEQERVARAMGHSVGMQRGYSWHAWRPEP